MAATLTYEYSVRNKTGKIVHGKLEAESEAAVVQRLKTMGYAPIRVAAANAGMKKELTIPGFGGRVKLKDLAVFSQMFERDSVQWVNALVHHFISLPHRAHGH